MVNRSSGYPQDNPDIMREAEEIIPWNWKSVPCDTSPMTPKDKVDKTEISIKDFNLLVHYKKAYEEVEAYWLSYVNNLWSLMKKRSRREREELLKEINLVEDFIIMMQDKRVL